MNRGFLQIVLSIAVILITGTSVFSQAPGWNLVDMGTTADITDVFFLNENEGWIIGGGDPCLIYKTTDGGETWMPQNSGVSGVDLKDVFFIDNQTGWIVGELSTMLLTTDGGDTWQQITVGETDFYQGVAFFDNQNGWIVSDSTSYILHSTDGGQNWENYTHNDFDEFGFRGIDFVNNTTGYIVGRKGKVFKTTDAGTTWTSHNYSSPKTLSSVSFIDEETGRAVGSQGMIIKTTSGATSWATEASGVTITFKCIHFLDANNGLACGQEGTLIKTTDGGDTWESVESGNVLDMKSVQVISADEAWACGEAGILLHYEATTGKKEISAISSKINIYPNPAKDIVYIENAISENITLMDITGKQIYIEKNLNNNSSIDVSSLPAGIYFLKFEQSDKTEVGRLIIKK